MLIQPIETQRLIIRHFEIQDWQAVNAYTADATVMRFVEEGQLSAAQAEEFIAENAGSNAKAFPVVLKRENKLIGHMIFHPWFVHQTYEIGWVFHPMYQGQGYATEAAHALLRYAFNNLQSHRVIATCQPENPASYRVMEKIGLRREGHFLKCIYRGENIWWDEYFYAILAEEWFARHT